MALIAGTGLAAKRGVIVKNGEAIQTSKEISVILMDKTGTITKGTPEVVYHSIPNEELSNIATIESNSNHPLAKAITSLGKTNATVDSLKEITGEGVTATIKGGNYFIGKPDGTQDYSSYYLKGQTVVEVKKNGKILGFIVIEDPIREDSKAGIEQIKKMGIHPIMATGDNETTARIVAGTVGIEEVYAGIKPEDKLNLIHKLRAQGKKVLMVGDGMNDAAALKGSDIGVAIGSGTDLAIDSADMIIVRGGISKITELVRISRKTFTVIRQNLFWAFVYNIIAIPLAMLGLLHPAIAELAMAFSSITVVVNSLQIKRLKWED
jgi:Cu+-exporting ATPase